jgi:hypothetical protein
MNQNDQKLPPIAAWFLEAHIRFASIMCWTHFAAVPIFLVVASGKKELADPLLAFFMSQTLLSVLNYLVFSFINILVLATSNLRGQK